MIRTDPIHWETRRSDDAGKERRDIKSNRDNHFLKSQFSLVAMIVHIGIGKRCFSVKPSVEEKLDRDLQHCHKMVNSGNEGFEDLKFPELLFGVKNFHHCILLRRTEEY